MLPGEHFLVILKLYKWCDVSVLFEIAEQLVTFIFVFHIKCYSVNGKLAKNFPLEFTLLFRLGNQQIESSNEKE